MGFSGFTDTALRNNPIAWRAQGFDPTFSETLDVSVSSIWNAPGSLASATEAEIIALSRDEQVPWYITPVLGMRNILSWAANDPTRSQYANLTDYLEEEVYAELRQPLSREEWEQSEHFRPNVTYSDNMNIALARVLAARDDRERDYRVVMGNASGGKIAGATILSIGAGIFEPVNLATGLGVSSAVGGALKASAAAASGSALMRSAATPIGRIATEGAIGAGAIEIAAHQIADITEEDYTMLDSFMNVAASIGISAGIHGIGKAYGRMRNRSVESAYDSDISAFTTDAIIKGRDPLEAATLVSEAIAADRVPLFSTLTKDQLLNPEVVRTKDGFAARYPAEEGVVTGALGKGKTKEAAIADLQTYYASDFGHGQASNVTPEYMSSVKRIQDIEDEIANLSTEMRNQGRERGVPVDEIDNLSTKIRDTQARLEQEAGTPKEAQIRKELDQQKRELGKLMTKHQKKIDEVLSQANARNNELDAERKNLEQFVIAEQQRNLFEKAESFYNPDRGTVYETLYEADPDIVGRSDAMVKMNEDKFLQGIDRDLQIEINQLREGGLLTDADIKAFERIQDQYEFDVELNNAKIASINCLKG